MTWEIALGIFALIGFVATVAGWTAKASGTLSKLNVTIDELNRTINRMQTSSDKIHGELYDYVHRHDKKLVEYEEKIKNLERNTEK